MKVFLGIIAGAITLAVLSLLSFESYKYFAPKYAAVDAAVFHESAQYNDGMVRDLENLQREYVAASADQKEALKAVVLHRFSVYPEGRLPLNLQNFYNQLKGSL